MTPQSSGRRLPVLGILAFFIVLVAPGAPDSAFPGVPLSSTELYALTGALIALTGVFLFRPANPIRTGWLIGLLTLVVVKVALAQSAVPNGWRGVYELLDEPRVGPIHFLSRVSIHPFRVDRQIDFDGPTFNLAEFNDFVRYGRHAAAPARDEEIPFRVQWTGVLQAAEPTPHTWTARCRGALAIDVDSRRVFDGTCPSGAATVALGSLGSGAHDIVVTYAKPANMRPLAVLLTDASSVVTPWTVDPDAPRRSARLVAATTTVGWAAVALLVLMLVRAYATGPVAREPWVAGTMVRLFVFAIICVLMVSVLRGSLEARGITTQLGVGDDPLAYEGNARDIVFNGLLMPSGDAVGAGRPFYFYPMYSYVLAGAHVLLGEDLSAAVFLNGVAVASLVLLGWWLGWRFLPGWRAIPGLFVMAVLCWRLWLPYSRSAFTDCLFAAMAFVALCATLRAVRVWSSAAWLLAGIAAALAAATRPSFMTYPPVLGMLILIGWKSRALRSRMSAALALAAGFLLGLAPFAFRNWKMSGQPVLLVNSWKQIPYFLFPPGEPNPTRYVDVSGLVDALRQAWLIFADHPSQVIAIELRKVAFTFGMLRFGPSTQRAHPEFVALSVLFLAALVLRRIPRRLAFVLVAFALSHTAAMVLAAPWTYGYKTILPLQTAFVLGGSFLLIGSRSGPGAPPDPDW